MLDVTFFALGMAFLDSSAVLPILLQRLGATGTIIGAFAAMRAFVFSAPQIIVAYYTHGRRRQKPWLALVATVTRLPLLAMPFMLLHAGESRIDAARALWAMILILTFWALGDGLGYVPWMEIVARAFDARTRGRFFAISQIASGLGSIGIGLLVVRFVLNSLRFQYPVNYAVLAGAAALLFQVSLGGVLMIGEPDAPVDEGAAEEERVARTPVRVYLRRLLELLGGNPVFVKLAAIQLLLGFGSAASSFYVLYAKQRYHTGDHWGGIYQALQALGVVVLMPLWALISERRNPASAVKGLAIVVVATPLIALTLGTISPWAFGLVYFLMGGSLGWGLWIVMNHYLLSHIAELERPLYVALLNLLFVPSALFPYIGGLLISDKAFRLWRGIPILFVLTLIVVLFGMALAMTLARVDETPVVAAC